MDRSNVEQRQKVGINGSKKHEGFLHLLFELDWAVGRIVATLLNVCLFIALVGMALISLWLALINIFEYQEGLSDISDIEAVFVILALVLLRRYFIYTRQTSERWWNMWSMPLIWYGRFVLVAWLVVSVVALTDLQEGTKHLDLVRLHGENYIQMFTFSGILLSLYIAVPSKGKRTMVFDSQDLNGDDSIAKNNVNSQEQSQKTKSDI
ncbi:hypothetical protein [Vibrio metschnikovii]|uniref:hypothetical protein n=1 Tax=Vibrio metschnikovii TaxID=28172 RepID=UPI001302B9B8|nr:hypothetical protein [Vibrio metschnikovii]EKO3922442.1 hypothetical protein [Vibrio metschnikovii]